MAQRHDESETSSSNLSDAETEKSLLNRRSYLKAASAAVAAVAGAGAAGTAAAADYETITIGAGETRYFNVGSGDTFANKLIDVTADNADMRIIAEGSGWEIRNVGIRGTADVGNSEGGTPNWIVARGDGVIDTVHFGGGVSEPLMRKGAIGVFQSHSGHLEINNVHMSNYPGTALYAATSAEGGQGTVEVNDSYFRNINISHIRIAADGSSMTNCTIHNTSDVPAHPTGGGTVLARGIYTGYGDPSKTATVRNCDIAVTADNTNGGAHALVAGQGVSTLRAVDCEVTGRITGGNVVTENLGNDPDLSVPAGTPTTPEAAASGNVGHGGGNDGDSDQGNEDAPADLDHTLTVSGTGTPANYAFSVDGDLRANPDGGELEAWDTIDGASASGWVTTEGHTDSFQFDGSVTAFEFAQGSATVLVDGERVDPGQVGSSEPAGHTLEIEGTGSPANYSVTVSESLEGADDSLEPWDTVDGASASGWVTNEGHVDTYRFTGEVTAVEFAQGSAQVYLDGKRVDPGQLGSDEPTVHTLSIEGTGSPANYSVTVSESLDAASDSLEPWDTVDGASASGWVTTEGHTDEFAFTGEVTAVEFAQGSATVLVDGERVDPGQL